MSAAVIREARKALEANQGWPSPHALAFDADGLAEDGREDLAEAINELRYRDGIPRDSASRMIFSSSGNDPAPLLRQRVARYKGKFDQLHVGGRVSKQGEFVERTRRHLNGRQRTWRTQPVRDSGADCWPGVRRARLFGGTASRRPALRGFLRYGPMTCCRTGFLC